MTNHILIIASSAQGKLMGNIIRDFKKYTSVEVARKIKKTFRKAGGNGCLTC